jgi:hypothetical protein
MTEPSGVSDWRVSDHMPLGLAVSIAMRLDHGSLCRRLWPQEETQEEFRVRIASQLEEARLATCSRAVEERSGAGFWSPERNEEYELWLRQTLDRGETTRSPEMTAPPSTEGQSP